MELTVIGNTTGFSDLDRRTIQTVFRGERSVWPSRATVVVVLPSARAPFAETFSREVFGMGRTAMQRYWLALVFQGRANPPVFMDTVETMIEFVRRTPGAIAMVPLAGDEVPRDLQIRMR